MTYNVELDVKPVSNQ